MLRSRKASFTNYYRRVADSSHFSRTLGRTLPILTVTVFSLTIPLLKGQNSANAAVPSSASKSCDGQTPPSKSSLDAQSGPDATKDHLKLSMKGSGRETPDSEGQFCKRSDRTPGSPSALSSTQAEDNQSSQPGTSPPIAEITGGALMIRANGQDFAAVLDAVRTATGISVEMPAASEPEPVFMNLGPVSTKSALMALLDGTNYNYVIVGSQKDPQLVTRLILTERGSQGTSLVASALPQSGPPQAELYGGQGVHEDADAQSAEPAQPGPPPPPPAVVPASVPTGINIQQLAAQANKTPGQILDELQKRQMQVLDDQVAAQPQP